MKKNGIMKYPRRIATFVLALALLFASMPNVVQAAKVPDHTVFSKKQVDARIKTIQDYYYNKSRQLKTVKKTIEVDYGKKCNVIYYIHGKDLMFAFGTAGKSEYRMYFYKNQMIRLLVDKPGQKRKTYEQLYKKLSTGVMYDESLAEYMSLENYGRELMDSVSSPKNYVENSQTVVITKVSGDSIVYHKLYCYGPDGCIWSIGKKAYKAKITSNTKILDGSESPSNAVRRDKTWLKKRVSGFGMRYAVSLSGSGSTLSKIEGIYFP